MTIFLSLSSPFSYFFFYRCLGDNLISVFISLGSKVTWLVHFFRVYKMMYESITFKLKREVTWNNLNSISFITIKKLKDKKYGSFTEHLTNKDL